MKRSPLPISPCRERHGPGGSVSRYDVGDVTASLAKTEREAETTAGTDEQSTTSSENAPVANEEPAEPPRRRYARRSSATMYNLHNYAEQVQSQQAD
jgi:hypothetical protein